MSKAKMKEAIDRLEALFEWGALLAATDPPEFMSQIADKIERLRQDNTSLLTACEEATRAFTLLERWIGIGIITGHRAKVLNYLGDAPEKVRAAIAKARGIEVM